jgi:tRNA threonylcarbamoyladenosine biosynthesis protein TsaB
MIVLGIDTSTLRASVALIEELPGAEARVLATGEGDSKRHSDNLLPLVDQVLAEVGGDPRRTMQRVGAIAIGAGPGSFTGLRIGMATAKGLAFSLDLPLWAASSLAALAVDAVDAVDAVREGDVVVAALDARRDEIFAGVYRVGSARSIERVGDEVVIAPAELAAHLARLGVGDACVVRIVGDAIASYGGELAAAGTLIPDARATPSAVSAARLALRGDRTDVLHAGAPAYIRKSEAELKFPDGNPGPRRS